MRPPEAEATSPIVRVWHRHDLVRVPNEAWRAFIATPQALSPLDGAQRTLIESWAIRGWPAIVRRRAECDAADALPIAVPLPPGFGKLRFAAVVPAGTAVAHAPVTLREAASHAPPDWQRPIEALLRLGEEVGLVPRVFGALLWQHMTGLAYLHPASDLDLLWPMTEAMTAALPSLLAGLRAIDAVGSVKVDGEIVLPDGGGINWRELDRAGFFRDVIVKRIDGLALRSAGPLLPTLSGAA